MECRYLTCTEVRKTSMKITKNLITKNCSVNMKGKFFSWFVFVFVLFFLECVSSNQLVVHQYLKIHCNLKCSLSLYPQ